MKRKVNVFDYSKEILEALQDGILLTTKSEDKINSMTISWGMLGIEWNKPIFTVFVRENRFTREQLDKSGEFTINIPFGDFNRKILGFCGTKSGRDIDKINELGLTLTNPDIINTPGIKELPLTLECKVIYKQEQDRNEIKEEFVKEFYPKNVDGSFSGANKDFHSTYYGEIVSAYIEE